MNVTKAELARLLAGRRRDIRRRPTLGPRDRARVDSEPTMLPTRGLTPAIAGPGRRTYIGHVGVDRIAVAAWDDERERPAVRWVTYATYRAIGWPGVEGTPGP